MRNLNDITYFPGCRLENVEQRVKKTETAFEEPLKRIYLGSALRTVFRLLMNGHLDSPGKGGGNKETMWLLGFLFSKLWMLVCPAPICQRD